MLKKVYVEITNMCNLNCDFCIKNSRKQENISIDNFKIVLDKLKGSTDYLYLHVLGEPLMHPNINELINIASDNFKINITTNGYLINKIENNTNIHQLNISLQAIKSDEEIDIYNVNNEEKLMLNMMYYTFYNNCPEKENLNSLQEGLERLLKNKNMMAEVKEIL